MEAGVVLLVVVIRVAFGAATAAIASSKGRNALGWFFAGLLIDCIALIVILCLSNLKEEEAKWRRSDMESRRLREQLKQERIKTESLQQHVHGRLDVHDDALGMDTRALTGPEEQVPMALPPPAPAGASGTSPAAALRDWEWFVDLDGRRSEPIDFIGLKSLYHSGRITEENLVWSSGMENWTPLGDVPGLLEELV